MTAQPGYEKLLSDMGEIKGLVQGFIATQQNHAASLDGLDTRLREAENAVTHSVKFPDLEKRIRPIEAQLVRYAAFATIGGALAAMFGKWLFERIIG